MLRLETLPASLAGLLAAFQACFTAPTLRTFAALVAGMIAQPGSRTVCGMLVGAGLSRLWHHSRAHRFFAAAVWSVDKVGHVVLRLVIELLPPAGTVVLAVDDTLFRRSGRKVAGAGWARDGSADRPEPAKITWGTCFVVVGVVVRLPFASRPVCLPVAARLVPATPKTGKGTTGKGTTGKGTTGKGKAGGRDQVSKQAIAAELVADLAAACEGRLVHVVADGWYTGCAAPATTARGATRGRAVWPRHVHLTSRLRANAALHAIAGPAPVGRPGAPRKIGDYLGKPTDLAATATWRPTQVERYGRTDTVEVTEVRCLWPGVYRSRPIRIILVRELDGTAKAGYEMALLTTDLDTDREQIITWYAARWSLEVAFQDAKQHTGVGQARNRTPRAVERTVPFGLYVQSLTIIWYATHGYQPQDVTARRLLARWYKSKTEPSYQDMIVKARRMLITARFRAGKPRPPTPEEILEVSAAWAEAAA